MGGEVLIKTIYSIVDVVISQRTYDQIHDVWPMQKVDGATHYL